MPNAVYDTVTATTDGDQAATVYLGPFIGELGTIAYTKVDFADGVDFTITSELTGQNLWVDTNVNASETVAPRQPTHTSAGAAILYASGGVAVNDTILLCNERIKIVIAQGGIAKSGTFRVTVKGSK